MTTRTLDELMEIANGPLTDEQIKGSLDEAKAQMIEMGWLERAEGGDLFVTFIGTMGLLACLTLLSQVTPMHHSLNRVGEDLGVQAHHALLLKEAGITENELREASGQNLRAAMAENFVVKA